LKILALADEECKMLWDYFRPERLEGVDLIISCGDLRASYLSFLATFTHAPVLYVHGNHDAAYERNPPEGCTCIEDTVYDYHGLRIAGLGGSMRYKNGPHQYNEKEMTHRVKKLGAKIKRAKGVDILVTHAPARGCHDGEDLPHRGFECFNNLLEDWKPKIYLHGHVHMNYGSFPREYDHFDTHVINAYDHYEFEMDVPDAPLVRRTFPVLSFPANFFKSKG